MSEPIEIRPLGGCNEVGLNATLFAVGRDAVLVDCGLLLSVDDAPGVDAAIIDFRALDEYRVHAVLLTHGHEDHIGGLRHLLDDRQMRVYGPALALRLLAAKFEFRDASELDLVAVQARDPMRIGPFEVEWVEVTHSIPEARALMIRHGDLKVFHTGDFKLDPHPVDNCATDIDRIVAFGDEGVDLLLSDSTNAHSPGRTASEREVGTELSRQVKACDGAVYVACFASHIHRVQNILDASRAAGRRVAMQGRSLVRTAEIGESLGILSADLSDLVEPKQLERVPRSERLVLLTGSQGEARAGLARMARGEGPGLKAGDTLILSARTIPGNDRAVRRITNAFLKAGVRVVNDRAAAVHCSGHAHAEELKDMLAFVRPRHFIPLHGDRGMLETHRALAEAAGVSGARIIENGESVVLHQDGRLVPGDKKPAPLTFIDRITRGPVDGRVVRARRKLSVVGFLHCVVDRGRRFAPIVRSYGVPGDEQLTAAVEAAIYKVMLDPDLKEARDLEQAVRRGVKARLQQSGVKPVVDITVLDP